MISFLSEDRKIQYISYEKYPHINGEPIEEYTYKKIFSLLHSCYLEKHYQSEDQNVKLYCYKGSAKTKLILGDIREEFYISLFIEFEYWNIKNMSFHLLNNGKYIRNLALIKAIHELQIIKQKNVLPSYINNRLNLIDSPLKAISSFYQNEEVLVPDDLSIKMNLDNLNFTINYPVDGNYQIGDDIEGSF